MTNPDRNVLTLDIVPVPENVNMGGTVYSKKNELRYNGNRTPFVVSKDNIRIGCTSLTKDVLDYVYETYYKHFPKQQEQKEITIQ